ncbi:unnamed protein product [Moneuplotes crassus]|uniref:Ubiquitin-like domain-containing protein n=1 Tax=Euplotes crassus TaxID=5936 RepID=A0AAD1UDI1_EUPCR|nr:unnamed protein product [Moneuplotes crassus]
MQRTLNIDLNKVFFSNTNLSKDPVKIETLEPANLNCHCGVDSVDVFTQDSQMLCSDCAELTNSKVLMNIVKKKERVIKQLKLSRRFLHEGTLYLEYSKNFISQKCYDRAKKEYVQYYQQYLCLIEEVESNFKEVNQENASYIQEICSAVDYLVKTLRNPKCNKSVDTEMRKVHIHLLKELSKVEDPEDPSNSLIDIMSIFYTVSEYETIKSKIVENDTLLTECKELRKKCEKLSRRRSRGPQHRRERKFKKKINKFTYCTQVDEVRVRKLQILVKLPNGKSIPLKVDPYDRISNVKLRIAEEEGITVEEQQLSYFFKELRDDKLIHDYKIQNNSILKLCTKSMSLAEQATLDIHTDDGIRYKVQTNLDAPISQLKGKIESIFGNKVVDKDMILKGRPLNERRSLKFYNYNQGDVLYLEDKKITIQIHINGGQIITKEIKPDETVRGLKESLLEEDIIDTQKSKLFFNGCELKLQYKTLKQLNIQHNSKLYAF